MYNEEIIKAIRGLSESLITDTIGILPYDHNIRVLNQIKDLAAKIDIQQYAIPLCQP